MKAAPPFELPHLYVEVSRKLNKGVPNAKKLRKHHLFQKWVLLISSPFMYIFALFHHIYAFICLSGNLLDFFDY